ncbi:SUR7/PalI family-domain-containing protein [Apodospora peruviana]|uniref:SUR7/PalI family-domain-containing protein n=1 Tax=Apodospora peruviana TaxID=516989 RepID=A0AAE0IJF1_9PEZI|nr:SUR7/PalI family-domain-containing protein [Apodospora peruviana]
MARTGFFHHLGTFFLLSATVLLIVTCISAPVVHNISLLKVEFGDRSSYRYDADRTWVAFGTFGYCENHSNAGDECTSSQLGYSPQDAVRGVDGKGFESNDAAKTVRSLTKAMVLHPIACGLNFIAFMLALGAGMVGSLLASLVAMLAFLTTVVIMIIDFVMFSIVRANINDNRPDGSIHAEYGAAAWTTLVSAICSLLGTIIVFLTCCSGRMHRRRESRGIKTDYGEPMPATTTRRGRRWF